MFCDLAHRHGVSSSCTQPFRCEYCPPSMSVKCDFIYLNRIDRTSRHRPGTWTLSPWSLVRGPWSLVPDCRLVSGTLGKTSNPTMDATHRYRQSLHTIPDPPHPMGSVVSEATCRDRVEAPRKLPDWLPISPGTVSTASTPSSADSQTHDDRPSRERKIGLEKTMERLFENNWLVKEPGCTWLSTAYQVTQSAVTLVQNYAGNGPRSGRNRTRLTLTGSVPSRPQSTSGSDVQTQECRCAG